MFGFCVGNDVTERAWQHRTHQWSLGKSFDTHAPIGPWITTTDEVGDPHQLGIRCYVNSEKRQDSNARHLVFNVWQQISQLSQAMTLRVRADRRPDGSHFKITCIPGGQITI